jgi:hypothetical protein
MLEVMIYYFWEMVGTTLHHSLGCTSLAQYFTIICWMALLGMCPSLFDPLMKGLKYYLMTNSKAL